MLEQLKNQRKQREKQFEEEWRRQEAAKLYVQRKVLGDKVIESKVMDIKVDPPIREEKKVFDLKKKAIFVLFLVSAFSHCYSLYKKKNFQQRM